MTSPFALLVLAAVAAPVSAETADVVVTMNSYGAIRVGMPVAEVRTQLLKLGRQGLPAVPKPAARGCSVYRASAALSFVLDGGKVARIETREPGVVTPSGLRIGSPIEKVRQALGSRVEEVQRPGASDASERSLLLVAGDQSSAIRVEADSAVQALLVGTPTALQRATACP